MEGDLAHADGRQLSAAKQAPPRCVPGAVRARHEKTAKAFDGFFLGPGFPRAYREAKEGPLHDET